MDFQVKTKTSSDEAILYLSGNLNEFAVQTLHELLNEAASKPRFVFNMNGITSINSIGIRDWILFLDEFQKKCPATVFDECSNVFIQQVMVLHRMIGVGELRSCYLLRYCDNCDHEQQVFAKLSNPAHVYVGHKEACEKCGEPTELEDGGEIVESLWNRYQKLPVSA